MNQSIKSKTDCISISIHCGGLLWAGIGRTDLVLGLALGRGDQAVGLDELEEAARVVFHL